MVSNFWNTLAEEETTLVNELPQKISVKHTQVPQEEVHELAVDIYETEERVYLVAPIAGVKSSDIQVSVNEDQIFIKGVRRNPFEEYNDKLYSAECFWGKFERKVTLPKSVDARGIAATFRNGILLVEAPRTAPAGDRNIKINLV